MTAAEAASLPLPRPKPPQITLPHLVPHPLFTFPCTPLGSGTLCHCLVTNLFFARTERLPQRPSTDWRCFHHLRLSAVSYCLRLLLLGQHAGHQHWPGIGLGSPSAQDFPHMHGSQFMLHRSPSPLAKHLLD